MKLGKVSDSILKRSVLKYCKLKEEYFHEHRNSKRENGTGVGEDCAVFSWDSQAKVMIGNASGSFKAPHQMKYAFMRAANTIYAQGGYPESATLHIMMPYKLREAKLKIMMQEAHDTARDLGIEIAAGHTETTMAVNYPCVSVSMLGSTKLEFPNKVEVGDDIVMTKWAGLLGTVELTERYEEMLSHRFSKSFLEQAKRLSEGLSVEKEAEIGMQCQVSAMHDIAEGGVFGALWELAERSEVGLDVDIKKIPLKQETVEICNHLDLNPYELLGSGSLLLTSKDGYHLMEALEQQGIHAKVIGKITDSNARMIYNEEESRFLEPSRNEELYRMDAKECEKLQEES